MRTAVTAAVVLGLLLGACGGEDDGSGVDAALGDGGGSAEEVEPSLDDSGAPAEEPEGEVADAEGSGAVAGGDGSCSVDVTGDLAGSWTGSGGQAAYGSDYLYTEDELRQQYEFLLIEGDKSFEAKLADGDPITYLLILNCTADDGSSLSLLPSDGLNRTTLPFGPGTYPVSGGIFGTDEVGFSVLGSLPDGSTFSAADGSLEIESWDASGIKGTWTVSVEDTLSSPPRTGELTGTFDFPCPLPSCAG